MSNNNSYTFFVLILAVCLTQVASDVYAPALPAIVEDFDTTIDNVQFSMAIYMIGAAVSQLFYGPLSEVVGRKPPMIFGLFLMIIGCGICLVPQIEILVIGRFVQGCGAGACASLWRSIFRDKYTGAELAKLGSYLGTFIMFITPAAPVLGGYLEQFFGWYANFIFMIIYSIVALLALIFKFEETNKNHHISNLSLKMVYSSYAVLLKSPVFVSITLCTFLSYGATFSWFVCTPMLLISKVGVEPSKFGWILCFTAGAGYGMASVLNVRLVKDLGMHFMLNMGFGLMLLSGSLMIILNLILGLNITAITLPMFIFFFGSTFIWPNAYSIAFSPFGHIAGYAGALYGFIQLSGAGIISGIISYLPDDNAYILGSVIVLSSFISLLVHQQVKYTR
jgi:DHA1 family bicyclomycin/chloramphenicol resistance-like MFS transporter/DHA1 family 2-module integral membrane pump EmrD-like MFS transporter